jgi:hypothetical protein
MWAGILRTYRQLTATFDRWNDRLAAKPKLLLLLVAACCASQIGPWFYATPDATSYLSIARSLWQPGGPTNLGRPQLYYSIGYPLVIAPTFLIDARPFLWISILHWLLTLVLLAGVYRWAQPFGRTAALSAALLAVLHALYGVFARRPLTEPLFMATMVWTALVLNQISTAASGRRRVLAAVAGTLLLTFLCLVRPHGVAMIPGVGAALVASAWGDRRRVLTAVAAAALIGGVAGGAFLVSRKLDDARATTPGALTYWDQFASDEQTDKPSLGARLRKGVLVQLYDFQRVVLPGAFKTRSSTNVVFNFNLPVAIAVTLIVALGCWKVPGMRGDVWLWSAPFYLALNVVWAEDAGTRYTVPLMPIILAAFSLGLARLWPAATRWAGVFVLLHVGVGLGYWLAVDLPRARERNEHWSSVERLAAMVDRDRQSLGTWKLEPDEAQFFLFTLDRHFLPYTLEPAPKIGGLAVTTTVPPDCLFADADAKLPPEYVRVTTDGPYALLRYQK